MFICVGYKKIVFMQIIKPVGCTNNHDIFIFISNSKNIGLTTWNEEWERKNDLVVLHLGAVEV